LITVAEGIRESYADKIDGGIYNMQELKKDVNKFLEIVPIINSINVMEKKQKN